jgi:hypothetical protein
MPSPASVWYTVSEPQKPPDEGNIMSDTDRTVTDPSKVDFAAVQPRIPVVEDDLAEAEALDAEGYTLAWAGEDDGA